MKKALPVPILVAFLLSACAQAPIQTANGQSSQLNASVQTKLNRYGFGNVDAQTLSRNQLARMRILDEGQPIYGIRQEIGVILAGP